MKTIIFYQTQNGKVPLLEWLTDLRDMTTRQRIEARILRVGFGNFGDHKSVGGGVQELRMTFGGGYRVYFGEDGNTLVVLLCGGDKKSQSHDIKQAHEFWRDYLDRKEEKENG
ncbi:MAG: type II toxin-antitoxin system RelE/ParE family toxin [Candidatus Sumerlaeia bacterium]|nr:type II toxin-antitoxin system RelE/ParE family toxin [Candidatus Sumerlaeia bacterium]